MHTFQKRELLFVPVIRRTESRQRLISCRVYKILGLLLTGTRWLIYTSFRSKESLSRVTELKTESWGIIVFLLQVNLKANNSCIPCLIFRIPVQKKKVYSLGHTVLNLFVFLIVYQSCINWRAFRIQVVKGRCQRERLHEYYSNICLAKYG